MNKIEEKLNKIRVKSILEEEKNSLWHSISVAKIEEERGSSGLLVNIFNKKMIPIILSLALILSGGGVVAASNSAIPGDALFPVDLAVEKIQLKFSSEAKKEQLKFKFTEERVSEVKKIAEKKGISVLVADLSTANVTEIEAKVYTNEIVVKIEANDRKYGFITEVKADSALIVEIMEKYSLTETKVKAVIVFNKEDRASRAEDKGFLNKTHSAVFSTRESADVGLALSNIDKFIIEGGDSEMNALIQSKLRELLILIGGDEDIKIERKDGKIKIRSNSGKIEIKFDKESRGDDEKDGDSDDSKDSSRSGSTINVNSKTDIRESDDEVFCRGEWRDAEDCDGSSSSDDDDDDDDEEEDEDDDDDRSGSDKESSLKVEVKI